MESNPFAKVKEDFKAAEDSFSPITEEIEAVLKEFRKLKKTHHALSTDVCGYDHKG